MSVLANPIRSQQYTANLNYTHVFNDSLDRELTANVDYNRYAGQQGNSQQNRYYYNGFADTVVTGMDIETDQVVDIYSAKVDFQTRFWQTDMELQLRWKF